MLDEVVLFSPLYTAVTIGFNATLYSVNECDGQVTIAIAVLNGTLRRRVVLHLSTIDLTANGKLIRSLSLSNE